MKNKRLYTFLAIATTLLLIPFVGMQFSEEVNWSGFDFLVAGILLYGTSLAVEAVLRNVSSRSFRIGLVISTLALLVLVWMELAVGIFGTPFAGS